MRRALAVTVVLLAAAAAGCSGENAAKPNVILILVDTLRADHLQDLGYGRPTDIGLDDFSKHSTRFTNAYSPAPWTGPSVASLFTGLFPARHGANAHGAKLPDALVTLAELLRNNGWTTAGYSFNPEISATTGYDQGFDHWDGHLGEATQYPDITEMFSRVSRWLDSRPRQPFFLYLQPMNCHGPYRTPAGALDALLGRPPSTEFRYLGEVMRAVLRRQDRSRVTRGYVTSLVEQYDTAIRYSTDRIGSFLEGLKQRGIYDDALIIVTADHGEELYDHGGFSHGYSLYEEVLHVPLYVKRPRQKRRSVVSTQVSLTDLYPTLVELLGLDADGPLDGRSFARELDGKPLPPDSDAVPPRLHQAGWASRCVGRAIVSGRHKLIEIARDWTSPRPRTLLFDLERDPGEKRDLADTRPDLVRRLQGELESRFSRFRGPGSKASENVLHQMDRERLRALGYLD